MRFGVVLAVVVALAVSVPAVASDYTWTGGLSNLWSTPGNWIGGVPAGTAGDNLWFGASAASPAVDSALFSGMHQSLLINGGQVAFTGGVSLTSPVFNMTGGQLQIDAGGTGITSFGYINTFDAPATAVIKGSGIALASTASYAWNTVERSTTPGVYVDLSVTAPISGPGKFYKQGDGLMITSGNNTYTNTTTVTKGTLLVNGTNSGQGMYTVIMSTLGGTGAIGLKAGAMVAITDARLAPGSIDPATGAHICGPLTINASSVGTSASVSLAGAQDSPGAFAINLASASSFDQLISNSGISLGNTQPYSTPNLSISLPGGYLPSASDTFKIVDNTGTLAITGTFANEVGGKVKFGSGGHGYSFDVNYAGGTGNDIILSNFAAATVSSALSASLPGGTALDFGQKNHPLANGLADPVPMDTAFNLRNSGDVGTTLTITPAIGGPGAASFHVASPSTPNVLVGGDSAVSYDLLFDGGAPGTYSATITLNGNNGQSVSYPVSAVVLYQGDANEDGKVSFADYIALANNFGQTGAAWTMGDFNGDGKVSFADYILLANNFGQHVPEPATLGLLLIGSLGLIRRNRK